ncbi:MAG: hypothetical protein EXQ67_05240 [Thermoleophilia bacterium]|nr:hypothetical protein [Thermoleophilia bacterium]
MDEVDEVGGAGAPVDAVEVTETVVLADSINVADPDGLGQWKRYALKLDDDTVEPVEEDDVDDVDDAADDELDDELDDE